jgi:hypothetical protein
MSILQAPPGSPMIVHALAAAVLWLHIGGGTVGILSGFAAIVAPKGQRFHRLAGKDIVLGMLVMAVIGALVSPLIGKRLDAIMGAFTTYLVLTSWMSIKRQPSTIGAFEKGALLFALALGGTALWYGWLAMNSATGKVAGYPAAGYFTIAIMLGLCAAGDLSVLLRGGLAGAARLTRHLLRMCAALFIAVASFFLGQQKVFPIAWRGSPIWFIPVALVLIALLYWLVRVRIKRRPRLPSVAAATA